MNSNNLNRTYPPSKPSDFSNATCLHLSSLNHELSELDFVNNHSIPQLSSTNNLPFVSLGQNGTHNSNDTHVKNSGKTVFKSNHVAKRAKSHKHHIVKRKSVHRGHNSPLHHKKHHYTVLGYGDQNLIVI